jgi:hypothetical protein
MQNHRDQAAANVSRTKERLSEEDARPSAGLSAFELHFSLEVSLDTWFI